MKNITLLSAPRRFTLKLICCIASGSATSAYSLLKSIAIIF